MALAMRLLIFGMVFATVTSAGLLESLFSWDVPDAEARSTTPPSKCLCQTSGCLCCVDLNLTTTIDLGGSACINLKQKEDNVTLNMSYGDGAIHNATTKIADAANKPTCMDLLSDLAQLCAKFTSVKKADSGFDGCLVLEPVLLGSPQATYPIGCFNFNQGIQQIEVPVTEVPDPTERPEEEEDQEEESLNTDELIAAVSASAEQGIALFSQWLGLNLNPKLNLTTPADNGEQESRTDLANATSRTSRKMAETHTEGNDERFKQILIAQDNIQKQSEMIGQAAGAGTTFVYSEPSQQPNATPENLVPVKEPEVEVPKKLTVIPRESRRGGRAYNIHQHVNEV